MTNRNGGGLVPADKARSLREYLNKCKPALAEVAAKHIDPDRLVRVVTSAAQRTPKLLDCTASSIAVAVMQAASLGLEAASPLGHAYVVPYGREATLIVGYKGLVTLALRSGEISKVKARLVYEGEPWDVAYGLDERLVHEPRWDLRVPGKEIAAYAVAWMRSGDRAFDVMTRDQIEAIRARGRSGRSGPWVSDWGEMAKKTVLRRLLKTLPCSVEMADALAVEDSAERGEPLPHIMEVTLPPDDGASAPELRTATSRLRDRLLPQGDTGRETPPTVDEVLVAEVEPDVPDTGDTGPEQGDPNDVRRRALDWLNRHTVKEVEEYCLDEWDTVRLNAMLHAEFELPGGKRRQGVERAIQAQHDNIRRSDADAEEALGDEPPPAPHQGQPDQGGLWG